MFLAAIFCLRLALGMLACLLLLSPGQAFAHKPLVGPRYFRTHFLTVLGLACGALLLVRQALSWSALTVLGIATGLAFLGSLSWALEKAPAGRTLIVSAALALLVGLILLEAENPGVRGLPVAMVGSLTSAAVLGTALSAMLMGHSYLIAPAMSLAPLFRLLTACLVALGIRMLVDGFALGESWTWEHSPVTLNGDEILWLPVRWGVGFLAPLVLCWMAWQTARIRSTQSATGILYVVVIFCFLGELTGQLLRGTGITL